MASPTRISKKKKSTSARRANLFPPMTGSDLIIQCLEREGVDTLFAYPGGASMAMHQSLTRSKKIRTILCRHEQGGSFMAHGYARATGKVGVCMATSGPGATNLLTGIADAFLDSVPLVAITGQVKREAIGKGAFQETDIFGMSVPVVKHSYLVMDAADIPRIVKEAFHIAKSGRPGPVLIDMPKDIQGTIVQGVFPDKVELRGFPAPAKADDLVLHEILGLIEKAERPVLYVGGGIITGEASDALRKFAASTNIPVTTTLMGIGAFPETNPQSLRWLGMHGSVYANYAVDGSDLLLAFGVRFDDRVTGNIKEFAKNATIVHIDVDNSELNKNKVVNLPILSDIKYALDRLNAIIAREKRPRKTFPKWHKQLDEWKEEFPFRYKKIPGRILPQQVMEELDNLTKGEAIISVGVGQHQMWAAQYYKYAHPRSFLSSSGLGTMGFGYPAALGAKVALPHRQVIDVDGDGSFLMNIQELATAVAENIPVKVIILNNQHLGMVVQWEDRFFKSNRGHTFLGLPHEPNRIYPDYIPICEGFGIKAERISDPKDLKPALERLLKSKESYFLDVMVPYTEHVLPMIPAGATVRDIILEPMTLETKVLKGDLPG
jgi:acetolactate synthase-1/2/3 large subunit